MSEKAKPINKLSSEQASSIQAFVCEALTGYTDKEEAIEKSKQHVCDFIDVKNLPEKYMKAIIDAGLEQEYKVLPKMLWSTNKKHEPVEAFVHFVSRVGKTNGLLKSRL